MAQRVTFDEYGDPDLGTPDAGGVPVKVPSGDGLSCWDLGSVCV